jgi:hypothetical protein
MNVGKSIYALLNADSDVTNIATGGIHPQIIPQGKVPPFIAYRVDAVNPHETKDGVSTVDHFDVTIACFAKKYITMDSLAQEVRNTLDGYQGTSASIVIDSIIFEDKTDLYDDGAEMHYCEIDFMIRVKN